MTKTHRIITEEEYDADGRLLHKTVTEETEEWTEDKPKNCPADCPGTLQREPNFQWVNPCDYGPSDFTGTPPSTEYTTTTHSELH